METKLKLDLEKMERTSRLISPVQGDVAQVLHVDGDLVREGSPIVLLHAPKAGQGPDDSGSCVRVDRLRAGRRGEEDRGDQ